MYLLLYKNVKNVKIAYMPVSRLFELCTVKLHLVFQTLEGDELGDTKLETNEDMEHKTFSDANS